MYDPLEGKSLKELDELDEDDEYADDHFLEAYREKRMAALRAARATDKYGEVRSGTLRDTACVNGLYC